MTTPEPLPKLTDKQNLDFLLKAIKDVREKQKAFFKARRANLPMVTEKLLLDSKEAERKLDIIIQLLETPENTQQTLL